MRQKELKQGEGGLKIDPADIDVVHWRVNLLPAADDHRFFSTAPEEKYFGLISVLFFLETRRKRNERAALQRWLQSPGTPWGAEARGKDGVRETLKQEVALSFCSHNEVLFLQFIFRSKKNVQNNLPYLGFSLKVRKKKKKKTYLNFSHGYKSLLEKKKKNLYYFYLRILSVNTFLVGGCWLYNNNLLFFFFIIIFFLFGKKSVACFFVAFRRKQRIDWR